MKQKSYLRLSFTLVDLYSVFISTKKIGSAPPLTYLELPFPVQEVSRLTGGHPGEAH